MFVCLLTYTRGAEWPRRGDRFFWSIFDHQNRSFEWRDILFGSHIFIYFVPLFNTKIVPLSGETYFSGPNFGDFSQKCSFWTILGTRKVCFTTQRNHFHEYFWTHFWRTDGRTDGRTHGRTHGRDQRTHLRLFWTLYTIAPHATGEREHHTPRGSSWLLQGWQLGGSVRQKALELPWQIKRVALWAEISERWKWIFFNFVGVLANPYQGTCIPSKKPPCFATPEILV